MKGKEKEGTLYSQKWFKNLNFYRYYVYTHSLKVKVPDSTAVTYNDEKKNTDLFIFITYYRKKGIFVLSPLPLFFLLLYCVSLSASLSLSLVVYAFLPHLPVSLF